MKIQLDIPQEINKELKLYKIHNDLNSIREAIIKILGIHFQKTVRRK